MSQTRRTYSIRRSETIYTGQHYSQLTEIFKSLFPPYFFGYFRYFSQRFIQRLSSPGMVFGSINFSFSHHLLNISYLFDLKGEKIYLKDGKSFRQKIPNERTYDHLLSLRDQMRNIRSTRISIRRPLGYQSEVLATCNVSDRVTWPNHWVAVMYVILVVY